MSDDEAKRAIKTREVFNLKSAEHKLTQLGYTLYDEVETYPPDMDAHHFLFLYHNTANNQVVGISTPDMTVEWGQNGPLFKVEEFLKDTWSKP